MGGGGERHNLLLCSADSNEIRSDKQNENKDSSSNPMSTALSNHIFENKVLLQTFRVILQNNNKEIIIRGILDTASERSYITRGIVNRIGYQDIGGETFNHVLFGGIKRSQTHRKYKVFISDLERNYACNFDVFDVEKICTGIQKISMGDWIEEAKQKGIYFSDFDYLNNNFEENDQIQLLIGADIYGKLLTGNLENLSGGPIAVHMKIGWTIMGKVPEKQIKSKNTSMLVLSLYIKSEKIKELWDLDVLGIKDPIESKNSQDLNEEALEFFNATVKREKLGRYQVSLPWICNHPKLSDNRIIAEKRLRSNVQKLKSTGYLKEYQEVFKEWEGEGIIEDITDSDTSNCGHFLPHRPVIRENATTRVRPVFDGGGRDRKIFFIKQLPR